jgi:hypothetical protein
MLNLRTSLAAILALASSSAAQWPQLYIGPGFDVGRERPGTAPTAQLSAPTARMSCDLTIPDPFCATGSGWFVNGHLAQFISTRGLFYPTTQPGAGPVVQLLEFVPPWQGCSMPLPSSVVVPGAVAGSDRIWMGSPTPFLAQFATTIGSTTYEWNECTIPNDPALSGCGFTMQTAHLTLSGWIVISGRWDGVII